MLLHNFSKFNHISFWGLWRPQRDLYRGCTLPQWWLVTPY